MTSYYPHARGSAGRGFGVRLTLRARAEPTGIAMHDYFEWKRSHLDKTSVPNYIRWIERFHNFLGTTELNFTLEDIGRYKTELQKTYSPKNIQYGLSILKDYIGYCQAIHDFQFPRHLLKIKKERSNSHKPLTQIEFDLMYRSLRENEPMSLQRKLMITLLWETGMRVGELTRLRVSDLSNGEALIKNEKNTKSRIIAWSPTAEALIQRYLPLRKHLKCSDDWLFVSFHYYPANKMSTRQVERIFKKICLKVGIRGRRTPHSTRHGFTHMQLDAGNTESTVAQMLGHSTSINIMTYNQREGREMRKAWGLK